MLTDKENGEPSILLEYQLTKLPRKGRDGGFGVCSCWGLCTALQEPSRVALIFTAQVVRPVTATRFPDNDTRALHFRARFTVYTEQFFRLD